jgi:Protein of unknown function (DUF2934)
MSYVSPAATGSPAPEIIPGARSSGTTAQADNLSGQVPTVRMATTAAEDSVSHDEIAAYAYRFWLERGCPSGSPEVDWRRAEIEVRERRQTPKASAASV